MSVCYHFVYNIEDRRLLTKMDNGLRGGPPDAGIDGEAEGGRCSTRTQVTSGVDHVFIGKTPAQTREANLKALEATFRFIDKTMNNVHENVWATRHRYHGLE